MNVYDGLHVKRVVNGVGSVTRLSGSLLSPEVIRAMDEAAESSVDMEYLQASASDVIAEITGAEAGLVTAGAAAGLTLATAACVAGLDIAKMEQLPDTSGMKNEVIVPRHHRNAYDHAVRLVGVKLVEAGLHEVGTSGLRSVESWEIESKINERTAAIEYVSRSGSTPPLEEVVRVGKKHGVPVIIDAAGQLPPASNLRRFIEQGVDLVVFSGGKSIRGPQSTGILCGRADLIMSAALQMLDMDCWFETWNPPKWLDKSKLQALPRHGIGRGFKVGKEEVVGLITALKLYAAANHDVEMDRLENMAAHLVELLSKSSAVRATHLSQSSERSLPLTEIKFMGGGGTPSMLSVVQKLKTNDPPIYLDESRLREMILQVNPFNLKEKDLDLIAARIMEFAQGATRTRGSDVTEKSARDSGQKNKKYR